jgi:zinc-ribbon domain
MVFCQSCGAQADPSSTFCHNCGKPLRVAVLQPAQASPPQQVVRTAPYAQMPSLLTGDGLDLMLYGFILQFIGVIVTSLGSSSIAALILGVIILLFGFGALLYGLNLFRTHYRSKVR